MTAQRTRAGSTVLVWTSHMGLLATASWDGKDNVATNSAWLMATRSKDLVACCMGSVRDAQSQDKQSTGMFFFEFFWEK